VAANGLELIAEHAEVETASVSRDVQFTSGLTSHRVPFIFVEVGADCDPFMLKTNGRGPDRAHHRCRRHTGTWPILAQDDAGPDAFQRRLRTGLRYRNTSPAAGTL
jgi:hypothetical protein